MLKLADWVLEETCRTIAQIRQQPDLAPADYIAVNLSHQQFLQRDFVDKVKTTLARHGARPDQLQFDITEAILIKDMHESVRKMKILRDLGVTFVIDDFGSGYSSLYYLNKLPVAALKIDGGFIRDIASDPGDAAIVQSILAMAEHLGLTVIAEGVETRQQLQFLRSSGCKYYQGYLARPPIDKHELFEELRHRANIERVE